MLQYIDEKVTTSVATKDDIRRLEGKIGKLDGKLELARTELGGNITNLKTELAGRIGRLEEKVEKEVATKVDLAKLEGRFQRYFAALAVLVVLTNPK